MAPASDFYLRYYVGHKGRFGHEFLEFEFRPDGQVRASNVLKIMFVSPCKPRTRRPSLLVYNYKV